MTPADGGEGRRQLDHGAQRLADFAATPLRSMAAVYVAFPAPLRSELGGDQPPAQGRRRYLSPGDGFQPRCDIYPVTVNVVEVDDDVTDIDPDSEHDPSSTGTAEFRSAILRWTVTAH